MLSSENPYASPSNPNPLPNSWAGQYAYDPTLEFEFGLQPITFTMSWDRQLNGTIKGIVNDGPESNMEETGTINGWFRDHKIEFTKYMPVETLINEDGSATRTGNRHPPIHYYGSYNPATQSLEGMWYIVADDPGDGCSGTWTAKPSLND